MGFEPTTKTRRFVGSNPIWGSDFFCVLLWLILYISLYFPLKGGFLGKKYIVVTKLEFF